MATNDSTDSAPWVTDPDHFEGRLIRLESMFKAIQRLSEEDCNDDEITFLAEQGQRMAQEVRYEIKRFSDGLTITDVLCGKKARPGGDHE